MSKPLILFLQFVGLVMLVMAAGSGNVELGVFGVVLVIIGGMGYRSKNKKSN